MHCLGAVSSGSASPQRAGNCGSVLGVVRALGVLVSEGRVQGPPRGYKEGPHCAAPLQPVPNNHVCEKDNYLCDRYVILVREIADRVTTCSYLCIQVLLCSDCPCGLAKATSKDPVSPIPSMSIVPWQQSSEMLLEYWCISVVPSKGPEMMNNQSLYQAVRSRLHFSQVAAWWSRSKGAAPSYVTTRVVSFSEENLRKFRETPSEHTFPLAACGDGNSIKVTVWALPRIEDVPLLNCPLHPVSEKEDEGAARALTPTKNIPTSTTSTNTTDALVLPTLVDDRLQTPCNEPGKHHCRCEDEDGCPPSPSQRANGERKRRRSLPRGSDYIPSAIPHTSAAATSFLPSVCELAAKENENKCHLGVWLRLGNLNHSGPRYLESETTYLNADTDPDCRVQQIQSLPLPFSSNEHSNTEGLYPDDQMNTNRYERTDTYLEKSLGLQFINLQEEESNLEKRYKCSIAPPSIIADGKSSDDNKRYSARRDKSPKLVKKDHARRWEKTCRPILFQSNGQTLSEDSSSFTAASPAGRHSIANINWTTSTISGRETECGQEKKDRIPPNVPIDTLPISHNKANLVINPFSESSPFHESNPGPSTNIDSSWGFQTTVNPYYKSQSSHGDTNGTIEPPMNHRSGDRQIEDVDRKKMSASNNDLSNLMFNLQLPEETAKVKDERNILDWISRVPSRVFNVAASNGFTDYKMTANGDNLEQRSGGIEVKSKPNCNLELSKREFDEVLAVLRAQTPAGRHRTSLRTLKRREKLEKQLEEGLFEPKSILKKVIDSNLNASGYPVNKNGQRAVIADRLGIVKFLNNGDDQIVAGQKKFEPTKMFCQKVRKGCAPEAVKVGVKLEELEAKEPECFYNVTNQADVLLGAILRTSNDPRKGLFDVSNGARPRKVLSGENCDIIKSDVYNRKGEKAKQNISGVKPFEDDRSTLPSSLNKRISQIKQLFKKDQEKKEWEDYSQECAAAGCDRFLNTAELCTPYEHTSLRKNVKDSRVKRRIDFSNHSESGNPNKYPLAPDNETHLNMNSLYQNRSFNGTSHQVQNGFLVNISERVVSGNKNKSTVEEGSHFSPTPIKNGTNLKLKIGQRSAESSCVGYEAKDNDRDSRAIFSQLEEGVDKDFLLPALHENDNYTHMDSNDASDKGVPSAIEQERFRRSLGNAASMVFHSRTGLPLTSSPAPLRRGSCCFDYDSTLNSVSSKRSALFELNTPPSPGAVSLEEGDREAENTCEGEETTKRRATSRGLPHSHALLGSFEESALNGRLEPVSTVHGFTAELGASGSFCPKHRKLPVTVFFYTLGDNDKVSTPYLAHINLGKKGYQVPRSGTIQVTLLNPLGTVVKMFVVMYDLSDMPSRSHTFLRQRTLRDKTLRYLIHLRFMSGKSGRIYLHTDIRMIICRKSDVDTASDLGAEPPKELRSFVHGPTNPKFSPRC